MCNVKTRKNTKKGATFTILFCNTQHLVEHKLVLQFYVILETNVLSYPTLTAIVL